MKKKIISTLLAIVMLFSASSSFMTVFAEDNVKKIYTVAGAHLDTTWLWNLETTVNQFLRNTLTGGEESATKSHVGNFYLMDKYPEYKFNFEGAYRYELIEEYFPEEWEKLKEYIANGQWNTAGALYENGDVTTPSPEALIRNVLYGNQYFADTFGNEHRTKDIYLPDAFGYGTVLPSVGAHTNLESFVGFKLHMGTTLDGTEDSLAKAGKWKSTYGFSSGSYVPFDSGYGAWVGPDGNYLFSALHQAGSYAGGVSGNVHTQRGTLHAQNIDLFGWNGSILTYGTGDRGGSPTEASVQAVVNSAKNNTETSQVIIATVDQWAKELTDEQKAAMLSRAYVGDLLMNQHGVGSYTARSISHRWNSRSELLAAATENASVLADWIGASEYPQDKLNEAWKRVIAHQFHDDITGTSNRECYERNWNEYIISLNQFAAEYENALSGIASVMDTSAANEVALVVHNPVGADRADTVKASVDMGKNVNYVKVYDADGKEVPSQIIAKNGNVVDIIFKASIPSMGYKVYDVRSSSAPSAVNSGLSVSANSLSNDKYTVTLNANGDIASIYDKEIGKELLASPIVLGIFDDTEGDGTEQAQGDTEWPAWEIRLSDYIDKQHKDYVKDSTPTITVEEKGNARVAIRVVREYNNSTFDQLISLEAGNAPVKVENNVNWFEDATLLKAVFNTTAKNEMATYDLGLGAIERTTNTGVQGEVPAQKWVDITDESGSYGISVLSDSKNGWDKYDESTMRLTLIHTPYAKGSWIGGQQSYIDFGENHFSFAVSSHSGTVGEGDTQKEAQFFTEPMTALQTVAHDGALGGEYSFASLSNNDVIIRAVKKAETGVGLDTTDDEYIVRFNEGAGKAQNDVVFTMGSGIASVRPVYGSEETIPAEKLAEMSEYRLEDGKLIFDMTKYEIRSFAVTLNDSDVTGKSTEITFVSLPYNTDMVSSNENKADSTLDTIKTAFPAELLSDTIKSGGVEFKLGSFADGENNAVISNGQTITLPEGDYNKAYILAFSLSGDRRANFGIGDQNNTVIIADAFKNVASWEMYTSPTKKTTDSYIKEQDIGFMATHHHENGEDMATASMYMFKYELDIPAGAESITLPADNNVVVAAVSVAKSPYEAAVATKLYDSKPVSEDSITDISLPDAFYLTFDDENMFDTNVNQGLANGGIGMQSGSTWSAKVTNEYANSGNRSFMLKFNMANDKKHYAYSAIYRNVNIPVNRGTYLEYWLYTGTEDAKYVNIELTFNTGMTLRDGAYYDMNGIKMHPASHAAAVEKIGEWTKYRCQLTPGTIITAIGLGLDTGSATHGFGEENFACVDDIYIGTSEEGKTSPSTPLVTNIRIAEGINTSSYPEYGTKKFKQSIAEAKNTVLNATSDENDITNASKEMLTAYKNINYVPPVEIYVNEADTPSIVYAREAFSVIIKTNTNAEKITVSDKSGKEYKNISASYVDIEDERVWTVVLRANKKGTSNLVFTASDMANTANDYITKSLTVK
ncbi:MAG: alpha-mannosidase [Clostridia bacterium]|nr:alpha-mannosidase [Clostridia bacterium]